MKELTILTNDIFFRNKYWGILLSIDLYNCAPDIIKDAGQIKVYVRELCKYVINMKPYGETQVVHFGVSDDVCGYSMTQLIETSLISGHFANKTNNAYIDIFSCKYFCPDKTSEFTQNFFNAKRIKTSVLLRE
jgi:S-adenosylmethionine/arginine decarboxylase-like enzyme